MQMLKTRVTFSFHHAREKLSWIKSCLKMFSLLIQYSGLFYCLKLTINYMSRFEITEDKFLHYFWDCWHKLEVLFIVSI